MTDFEVTDFRYNQRLHSNNLCIYGAEYTVFFRTEIKTRGYIKATNVLIKLRTKAKHNIFFSISAICRTAAADGMSLLFQCAFSLRCFLAASFSFCAIPSKSPSEFTKAAIWEYCTINNHIFLRGKISYYTHISVINIRETLVPDCQFQNNSS